MAGRAPHVALVAWGLSLAAAPLVAQSPTTATISGSVVAALDVPLPGSTVTLTSLDRGVSYETTTDGSGAFRFALVTPGAYELRAELVGYTPVVARTLEVSGGGRASVTLPMAQAPPGLVVTVDTVSVGAAAASRFEPSGVRLGQADLAELPFRFEDLSGVAALAPGTDEALGSQGLPGSMTLTVFDGVPVYRPAHPVARGERVSSAAFPRSVLAGVRVVRTPRDVDWGGSAAGRVAATTPTGTVGDGLSVEGAWSGGPLWSTSELDGSKPSLLSFQGAGSATIPVSPGESQILIAGDALQHETPLGPRIDEAVATSLSGVDSELVTKLGEPAVETYSRFAGLARFDAQTGVTSHLFFRGAAGYAKREFAGHGPVTLAPAAAVPEESVEYSFAGGYIREFSPELSFEVRGGLSGGTRTFDAVSTGMPAATLVGSGSALGFLPSGTGESSRTDVLLSPLVHYRLGGGTLRAGTSFRYSRHKLAHERPADFFFSDGPALVAGQGYARAVTAPDASFTTQEVGAFLQLDSEPTPGFFTSVGVRFDYERLPDEATLNTAWLQTSGVRNDDFPGGLGQLGVRGSVTWTPTPSTELYGVVSVQHGDVDPTVLGEAFSRDDGATETVFAGSGLTWPAATMPAGGTSRPTLTLLGPDTRAPRSMQASAGVVRELFSGWSVHVGGAFRRTDFLVRRRNLNVPLLPQGADPYGRDVYGTLEQDGSLVTATGTDARRFDGFGAVWALDPDGSSEYLGVSGGVEYTGDGGDLFVTYTWSETTDNWTGAMAGAADVELSPLLPDDGWSEGVSDFDAPHRVTAAASAHVSLATVSAVYRFRSGYPFTPRYRAGVDANGDGSVRNDVAFVEAGVVDPLLSEWSCVEDQVGGFAGRNSCRGPSVHSVDVRLRLRLTEIAGREASLVVDGLNLVESSDGVVDDALLLVDPSGSIDTTGGVVTLPTVVNPDFGRVLYPTSRGRMIRVGFRIGG